VGTKVSLAWDNLAGHVFDATSGARLAIDIAAGSQSAQRHSIININQGNTFA